MFGLILSAVLLALDWGSTGDPACSVRFVGAAGYPTSGGPWAALQLQGDCDPGALDDVAVVMYQGEVGHDLGKGELASWTVLEGQPDSVCVVLTWPEDVWSFWPWGFMTISDDGLPGAAVEAMSIPGYSPGDIRAAWRDLDSGVWAFGATDGPPGCLPPG